MGTEQLFVAQLSLFLYITGFSMYQTITQLIILKKICIANGFDKNTCQDLSQHTDAEDKVQDNAAAWSMKFSILLFVPAAFLTLVFGPLSDVYGRKKILLISMFCSTMATLTMFIQCSQTVLSPVLLYGSSLLMGLGGGIGTFVSTMLNYVTDFTPQEHRTERLSSIMPFMVLGRTVGSFCSGILWDSIADSTLYLLVLVSEICTVLSILFFLKESIKVVDKKKKQSLHSLRAVLNNVMAGWRVVTAQRPRGQQRMLQILLFTGLATIFCREADISVVALYTRRVPFQWTPSILSYFTVSKTVMNVIGMVAVTKLYIKLTGSRSDQGDLTLMCIGFGAAAVQCVVMAVAPSAPYLILVPLLTTLLGPLGPVDRSLTSKLVQPSETGALSGFMSFRNNLAVPLGGVLFMSLYTKTVHAFPGAVFIAIMAVNSVCLLFILYLKNVFLTSQR